MESDLIPYSANSGLSAFAVLVLAPHPDDEVFGCGGAIACHVRAGVPVAVVILTDGAGFGDVTTRIQESMAAAQALGYGQPEFWGLPDRNLHYSQELVQRILERIGQTGTDLIYAPSPWEVHPDHRQASLLATEAVRRAGQPVRLAFYEVGAPLRPNVLTNITDVLALKEAAMRCFESQLVHQDYARHILALNQYRTYTLTPDVLAAEAYWVLASNELEQLGATGLFQNVSPGMQTDTDDGHRTLPLVSILIRSMDRETLAQVLDSVALQTYSQIEVVLVAAIPDHQLMPGKCGAFPLRLIQTDTALQRCQAANKALEQAHGDLLLFLDDDDWLMPGHIARLAYVLAHQPQALAAYTGISLVNAAGKPMGQVFDMPFDPIRQLAGNLTPIHAVLFRSAVLEQGCRFDETLNLYEDWDFWLQLARLAPMIHLPGVSGAYRIHESSGVHTDAGPQGSASALIYGKWSLGWTTQQIGQIMQRVWLYPELQAHLDDARLRLAGNEQHLDQMKQYLDQTRQCLAENALHLIETRQSLADARQSLADTRQNLVETRQNLAETTQHLAQARQLLANSDLQLADHKIQLAQSAQSLLEIRQKVVENEQQLADSRQLLANTQQQQQDTQQRLTASNEQLKESLRRRAQYEEIGVQKQQQIELQVCQIEWMQENLVRQKHDHAALLNSHSWRITRPLRWLAESLRSSLPGKIKP